MKHRNVVRVISVGLLLCCVGAAHASDNLTLAFTPDRTLEPGAVSPEGCYVEAGPVHGFLTAPESGQVCHRAQTGSLQSSAEGLDLPLEFISQPFSADFRLAGPATIRAYIVDALRPDGYYTFVINPRLDYELHELGAAGAETLISSGPAVEHLLFVGYVWGTYGLSATFNVGAHHVHAGSRLRLRLRVVDHLLGVSPGTSALHMLFGGDSVLVGATGDVDPRPGDHYGDSGITFALDDGSKSFGEGGLAGALPSALLLPLLLAALRRRIRVLIAALALACS